MLRLRSVLFCMALLAPAACDTNDQPPPPPARPRADTPVALPRPPDTVKRTPIAATDSIGPLAVSGRYFTVLLQREDRGAVPHVRHVQIRDERGVAHYDERLDQDTTRAGPVPAVSIDAFALRGEQGQGLALRYERSPSAPLSGAALRIFGLRGARLVSLAPALTVYGSFGDLQPSREGNVRFLLPGEQIEVEVWQGRFGIIVPLRVQLGCNPATHTCIWPQPWRGDVVAGLGIFRVRMQARQMESDSSVVLYETPDGRQLARIAVTPATAVEVIEAAAEVVLPESNGSARVSTRREWLHVRIGTREGWIPADDAGALGWPQAG